MADLSDKHDGCEVEELKYVHLQRRVSLDMVFEVSETSIGRQCRDRPTEAFKI